MRNWEEDFTMSLFSGTIQNSSLEWVADTVARIAENLSNNSKPFVQKTLTVEKPLKTLNL